MKTAKQTVISERQWLDHAGILHVSEYIGHTLDFNAMCDTAIFNAKYLAEIYHGKVTIGRTPKCLVINYNITGQHIQSKVLTLLSI